MGKNNVLEPARWGAKEADTVTAPISLQDVKNVLDPGAKKLMWWYVRPLSWGYNPFLVAIRKRIDVDNVTIQFVDHETGSLVGGEHDINLEDKDLIHREPPSSRIPAVIDSNNPVVVLMMNHQEMSKAVLDDAVLSNAWPDLSVTLVGKWPETALNLIEEFFRRLRLASDKNSFPVALKEVLREMLDAVGGHRVREE